MADKNQDVAQAWKGFDETRRKSLLAKMTPDQKKNLRSALEDTPAATDLTPTPGKGTYRMLPASQQGYTDTSQEKIVSYDKVKDALNSGYKLHPDETLRYTKDKAETLPDWRDNLTKIDPHQKPTAADSATSPAALRYLGREGVRALSNIGSGGLGVLLHPIETAKGIVTTAIDMSPPAAFAEELDSLRTGKPSPSAKMAQQFVDNPLETAEQFAGQTAVMDAIGKALPKAVSVVKDPIGTIKSGTEAVRNEIRETAGTWKNTESVVKKFGKESEKARADNEKVNKDRLDQLKKEHDDRLKTLADNRDKIKNYDESVKKTKAQNDIEYRREVERQKIEGEHKSAAIQLKNKVQAAFKKATTNYNATWNKWRDMVKGVTVKMNPVVDTISAQEKSMNPQQISIFRDILRETEPSEETKTGLAQREELSQDAYRRPYDKLTAIEQAAMDQHITQMGIDLSDPGLTDAPASRLHGWKSQLERAVRSTQDGTIRYAIAKVLQSVRELEEQASDTVPGAKKQLLDARKITGPYFDAFFKSPEDVPKAAGQMLREQTPEQMKAQAQQERVDRIAAYDPSIKSLANHIDNLEAALKNTPKPKELKDLPNKPDLDKKPEPKPLKDFDKGPEVPNIQRENMPFIADKLRWYGHIGSWVLRLVVGGGTKMLSHGTLPEFGGELALGQVGVTVLTRALRKQSVLEWLSKPSAEDLKMIDTLHPQDAVKMRKILGKLAEVDESKPSSTPKPKISPVMAAWLANGSIAQKDKKTSSIEEVKKKAEELQKSMHLGGFAPAPSTATPAPGPQSSNQTHTHIWDEAKQQIVPV